MRSCREASKAQYWNNFLFLILWFHSIRSMDGSTHYVCRPTPSVGCNLTNEHHQFRVLDSIYQTVEYCHRSHRHDNSTTNSTGNVYGRRQGLYLTNTNSACIGNCIENQTTFFIRDFLKMIIPRIFFMLACMYAFCSLMFFHSRNK